MLSPRAVCPGSTGGGRNLLDGRNRCLLFKPGSNVNNGYSTFMAEPTPKMHPDDSLFVCLVLEHQAGYASCLKFGSPQLQPDYLHQL